ncbi:Fic family protein [Candidatus Sumerlaeota bacterium]|nr:Fic family protein [Candidatus Sumerlaeota bacterium]
MPYQKEWVEGLQKLQIIREVAGTSRIEGAEFTEKELEVAMTESATELETRSQRQARASSNTYQWIEAIPDDRPINRALIEEIHRRIVTGADDDHCPPGELRKAEENVNFGQPRHRGCEGGAECEKAFSAFLNAIQTTYKEHDLLVQALGMHFHLAAMHPFLDGNGRTVRALEALYLQRAGLRQSCFIAMSNYYYEEKNAYLASLSSVSRQTYDLTPFLKFGLKGIALQTRRLLREIEQNVQKALFANLMHDLFARLKSPRKRVIAERQLKTLKIVLAAGEIKWSQLREQTAPFYSRVKDPHKAQIRDINGLGQLKTLKVQRLSDGDFSISANLEWPTLITHTEFFEQIRNMPTAKGQQFLR